MMPEPRDLRGHHFCKDVVPGPQVALASQAQCATPAPGPSTWCTPESVHGCDPALQYGTARRPSPRTGARKTSQTLRGHGPWPEHAGESCPGSTAVSLSPTSTADDHQ